MNRREAHRLALVLIADELGRSLATSDEWVRHPETDEPLTTDEVGKMKREARSYLEALETRLARIRPAP